MRPLHPAFLTLLCACALFGTLPSRAAEPLTWEVASAQPSRFVAVHGRRSAVFGYSENGLEVWAYPLQLVDSFSVAFRPQQGTTAIEGRTILRRIEYRPESVTRIYVGHDFVVQLFSTHVAGYSHIRFKLMGSDEGLDLRAHFTIADKHQFHCDAANRKLPYRV